jgi:FkbM family methyltransferase
MTDVARPASSGMHAAYHRLARSRTLTRVAVLLRNQLDHCIKYHFADTFYSCEEGQALLLHTLGTNVRRFVDVGANVGDWTAEARRASGGDAEGILIEPCASAIERLRERFRGDAALSIVPAAAGAACGEAIFYEEPNAGQTSTLVTGARRPSSRARPVPLTTLEREVAQRGWQTVDVVKIDAEGYDLYVMRGMQQLLAARQIDIVQFEYNGSWRQAGALLWSAVDLIAGHGYVVFLLCADGLREINYRRYGEYFAYSNYVAVSPAALARVAPIIRDRY